MENQKLISVIVPAYNSAAYIAQCLDCLMAQTYRLLEVIVIDDGSEDETAAIVSKYPVKLISKENGGVASSRNRGIEEATGEYIHFLDADDVVNLDYYEKMMQAVEISGAELACSGLFHERLPALSTSFTDRVLYTQTEDKMMLTNAGVQGYSVKYLIKKELINRHNHRFDESLWVAEDMLFSFKLVYWAKGTVSVPGATYYYKYRDSSVMGKGGKVARNKRKLAINQVRKMRNRFALENNIEVVGSSGRRDELFKLFGFIPFLKKRTYDTGRIRWYLFGVVILQKKEKD